MKSWLLAVCSLALLGTAGCRTPPAIALLEQENRDLEDRVYELADLVDASRRENEKLRNRLGSEDAGQAPIGLGLPLELTEPASRPGPTETEIPDPGALESLDIEVPSPDTSDEPLPEVHHEESGAPPSAPLPAWPTQRTEAPKWNGASDAAAARQDHRLAAQPTARVVAERTQVAADNTRVAAILLDERLTRGYNLDGRAGDEGIVVQVEPRDSSGQPLPAAAPLAVVVLDPHLSGEAARVARWDFSAGEVADRFYKSPHSQGIRLEMVWPGAPPIHDRLHLFVRYVTDDGRKLEADRAIKIDLPSREPPPPTSAGPSNPVLEARPAASGWQGKPIAVTPLPTTEPVRTARLPRPLRPPTTPPPESSPPQANAPEQPRPAWSPDRP